MTLGFLIGLSSGQDEAAFLLLIFSGLVVAPGLITGGVQLMSGKSSDVLFFSALAAAISLLVIGVLGSATLYGDDADTVVAVVVLGFSLPVVTAILARVQHTVGWVRSRR